MKKDGKFSLKAPSSLIKHKIGSPLDLTVKWGSLIFTLFLLYCYGDGPKDVTILPSSLHLLTFHVITQDLCAYIRRFHTYFSILRDVEIPLPITQKKTLAPPQDHVPRESFVSLSLTPPTSDTLSHWLFFNLVSKKNITNTLILPLGVVVVVPRW